MFTLTFSLNNGSSLYADCAVFSNSVSSSFVNDLLRYLLNKYEGQVKKYCLRENDNILESYSFEN